MWAASGYFSSLAQAVVGSRSRSDRERVSPELLTECYANSALLVFCHLLLGYSGKERLESDNQFVLEYLNMVFLCLTLS